MRLEDDKGIACRLNIVSSKDFSNECHLVSPKSRTCEKQNYRMVFFLINELILFLATQNSTQDKFAGIMTKIDSVIYF